MAISKRICSIENCGKPVRARGWCQPHWLRWSRHGDPLLGGVPRGSSSGSAQHFLKEEVFLYEGNECLIWPYGKDGHGYGPSRIVCEEAHGAPPTPKHEAAHSCGNGHLGCVTKGHLSWKTRAGNFADKLIHDTHNRGERNGAAKLTEETVRAIKGLKGKMTLNEIGKLHGTSAANVSHIFRGDSWAWL